MPEEEKEGERGKGGEGGEEASVMSLDLSL